MPSIVSPAELSRVFVVLLCSVKVLKIWTPAKINVVVLKSVQLLDNSCIQKMQMELQTVFILIGAVWPGPALSSCLGLSFPVLIISTVRTRCLLY